MNAQSINQWSYFVTRDASKSNYMYTKKQICVERENAQNAVLIHAQNSVSFAKSSPERCKFEIWIKMVKPFGFTKQFWVMQLPVLCKLNYGYHNQARFHQYLSNGILFSSKIWHGLWEKYELSCDTKISKKFFKKLQKLEWAPLNANPSTSAQAIWFMQSPHELFIEIHPLCNILTCIKQMNEPQILEQLWFTTGIPVMWLIGWIGQRT